MKIAVTGAKGRLGSELVRRGCAPVEADVTRFQALALCIDALAPDVVVHCAACTDVDACESHVALAARVNAEGTQLLGQAFRGPIVYISTDYIFDGQAGPYGEDAAPNPIGVYGWSKLGGEIAIRNRKEARDLIVRTTVLFDELSPNFVTNVIARLRAGETIYLPEDLRGSPTYVPHLANGILAAIERGVSGILNLAGSRVMSRYELGLAIAGQWNFDRSLVKPLKELRQDYSYPAPRPPRAGLLVDKALSLGLPIGDPLDGLEAMHALETMETR